MKRRNSGFSFLEIVIAIAILMIVVGSIYSVFSSSSSLYTRGVALAEIQEHARKVVDKLADELRLADQATMSITTVNGSNQIAFRINTGFIGSLPQWGTVVTYNYQSSAVDANGNKVADEGRIVRNQNARDITLCHYVKSGGFVLTQTGNNVRIRLTIITVDDKNRILETFVESSVTLRNSST